MFFGILIGILIGIVIGVAGSVAFNHWDVIGPEVKRLFGK